MSVAMAVRSRDYRLGTCGDVCCGCGAPMRESLKWEYDDTLFTLSECSQPGCPARHLRREAVSSIPGIAPLRPVTAEALRW